MPIVNMPLMSAFGNNVKPFDGAKMFIFEAGTSTPKTTFTTNAESVEQDHPVVADADGRFPAIYLSGTFKQVLKDKNDVTIWTEDNLQGKGGQFVYLNTTDFDSTTNAGDYPAAGALGDTYRVGSGFTLNAASGGHILKTGDFISCNKASATAIDADWDITRGKIQNTGTKALTDQANIATDCSEATGFTVTLGGNRTLDNPTNKNVGEWYSWEITQDGTGSRTLAFGTDFNFQGVPNIDLAASAVTVITGRVVSPTSIRCSVQGRAETKNKNTLINGGCEVAQHDQFTCGAANDAIAKLTGVVGFGEVDRIRGYTTQTASAGTIDQITDNAISTKGFGAGFTNVTISGAAKMHWVLRIEAKDAARFKGGVGSFSCKVFHNVGSAKTVTVYTRDPDVADTFSATSAISNDGGTSVADSTVTTIKFENIDFSSANPERGLEIEIELDCGEITTKDFIISELKLETGQVATAFESRLFDQELASCQRYYYRISGHAVASKNVNSGQCISGTQCVGMAPFPVVMRISPTALEQSGTATDYGVLSNVGGGITCSAVPAFNNGSPEGSTVLFQVASGLSAGNATMLQIKVNGHLGFSAEL